MTGDEAVAALPACVRVAGYDFAIAKMNWHETTSKQRWGECSTTEQSIRLQASFPTPFKAVDTFLHEAMHAVFWAYGVHDEDKEERIVATLGTALMTLHRDNPWLAGWIAAALKD